METSTFYWTWSERVHWRHTSCWANEDGSAFNGHAEPIKAHLAGSAVVCKQSLGDPQAG